MTKTEKVTEETDIYSSEISITRIFAGKTAKAPDTLTCTRITVTEK